MAYKPRRTNVRKVINRRKPTSYYYCYPERQNWPYKNPLPYLTGSVKVTSLVKKPSRMDYIAGLAQPGNDGNIITNKALNKVYEQLGQMESLRVAWAERQKSIDLATKSIRTLINIARAVKRRDPKIVRAVLERNPSAKDIIKTPSGLWLSYHFGIVPTVSDLHHAMGIFTSAIPPYKVTGVSQGRYEYDARSVTFDGYNFYPSEGAFGSANYRVKLGCHIMGIDTNVQLATNLGFGQPLSVAWELMAFSWLIDYVVNVGEFIKNFEPRFPGLNIERMYTSRSILDGVGAYGWWQGEDRGWVVNETVKFNSFTRTLGFPMYELTYKSPADLRGQQLSYVAAVFLPMLVGLKKK